MDVVKVCQGPWIRCEAIGRGDRIAILTLAVELKKKIQGLAQKNRAEIQACWRIAAFSCAMRRRDDEEDEPTAAESEPGVG